MSLSMIYVCIVIYNWYLIRSHGCTVYVSCCFEYQLPQVGLFAAGCVREREMCYNILGVYMFVCVCGGLGCVSLVPRPRGRRGSGLVFTASACASIPEKHGIVCKWSVKVICIRPPHHRKQTSQKALSVRVRCLESAS